MILISSIFIILTVIFYVLEQEFGFYTFLGTLLIPLIFFIFGILGIVAATKRVEIYKGKVVYHIGFTNKEYRMSDIRTSKTQTEKKYHIYLTAEEQSRVIQSLIRLKNELLEQGRYTDAVDDVLCKVLAAKKKHNLFI